VFAQIDLESGYYIATILAGGATMGMGLWRVGNRVGHLEEKIETLRADVNRIMDKVFQ